MPTSFPLSTVPLTSLIHPQLQDERATFHPFLSHHGFQGCRLPSQALSLLALCKQPGSDCRVSFCPQRRRLPEVCLRLFVNLYEHPAVFKAAWRLHAAHSRRHSRRRRTYTRGGWWCRSLICPAGPAPTLALPIPSPPVAPPGQKTGASHFEYGFVRLSALCKTGAPVLARGSVQAVCCATGARHTCWSHGAPRGKANTGV